MLYREKLQMVLAQNESKSEEVTYKVGVIIPFYGGTAYLQRLIFSILSDIRELDIKIYIVDNSKPSERLPTDYIRDKRIIILNEPTGIGFGSACNAGFEKAKEFDPDFVFIVNQDGYFESGALKTLVEQLVINDEFTVAMPLLTKYESLDVESFFIYVYVAPMEQLVSDLFNGCSRKFYPTEMLCGACFVVNARKYPFSFLFDRIFYMYYEDADLGRRLALRNHKIMLVPKARFHHSHTNSNVELHTVAHLYAKQTSRHIFTLKNPGRSFRVEFLHWSVNEVRAVLENLLKLKFKSLFIEIASSLTALSKIFLVMKSRRNDMFLPQRNASLLNVKK